ncbi:MAG: intracellular growth attenuator family protein [Gammaproteobacteria bacterium]|nr:intracellular growth attenuator family protein [Gammaproteobacteria bacterium]
MQGIGEGLAALAFWGFIAAVVVAGIWYGIREQQAQHETLRRIIDSGQAVDPALVDQVLGGGRRTDRGLKIAGLIVIFVAPGLAVLAWFISQLSAAWLMPLLGAAALVAFVGIGLLVAARFAERSYREDENSTLM